MGIRAFGAVEVEGPDGRLRLRGAREREVLGMLVSRAGRVVADDVLVEELWGDETDPAAALKSLRVRVTHVRRTLSGVGAVVEHVAGGYRLIVDPADVDVERFRAAASDAASAEGEDRITAADRALAEWTDEPFAEFRYLDAFGAVRAELVALRREMVVLRTHAIVDQGRSPEAVDVVLAEVADAPGDEALVRAAMRSLAGAGRPSEALDVFGSLVAELADRGLEPSPATLDFEDAILTNRPVTTTVSETRSVGVPHWDHPIGRDEDVDRIVRMAGAGRVVVVVGAAGVGKTRVAAAVAVNVDSRWSVWWVPVADARSEADVWQALAGSVGARPSPDAVLGALQRQRGLVIIDNAEQVVDDVRRVTEELLATCPGIGVLVTSRIPLRHPASVRVRLSPLEVPPPSREPGGPPTPAMELFHRVAQRVGAPEAPDGEVADLVRTLDGLPLAIELAATRSAILSIEEILRRFEGSEPILDAGGGSVTRTIEWSIDLLDPIDRAALGHLSSLAAGFGTPLAEAVVADGSNSDPLSSVTRLVDHSLLEVSTVDGERRLHLLEPVRQVAALHEDDIVDTRARAARHLAAWVGSIDRADPVEAIAAVRRWLHQLRPAFDAAVAADPGVAVDLAADTAWFWSRHGEWQTGIRWMESAIGIGLPEDPQRAIDLLSAAAGLALFSARDPDRAAELYAMADDTARGKGLRRPFNGMSLPHSYRGDYAEAIRLLEAEVEQCAEHGWDATTTLANIAHLHVEEGRVSEARSWVDRAATEAARTGRELMSHVRLIEAQVRWREGDADAAIEVGEELLDDWRNAGVMLEHQASVIHLLAQIDVHRGDFDTATSRLAVARTLLRSVDRDVPHHLLLTAAVVRGRGGAGADRLTALALARVGSDEMLFPTRRDLIPPGSRPAEWMATPALLDLAEDALETAGR